MMVIVCRSNLDMIAVMILVWEIASSEAFADNRDGRSLSAIGISQQTPVTKGNIQNAEVIRRNRFDYRLDPFSQLRSRTPPNRKIIGRNPSSFRVRNIADEGSGGNSWRAAEPLKAMLTTTGPADRRCVD